MRIYIIQFLLIILLSLIFGLLEYADINTTMFMYRAITTYVISKKMAMLICGMESD